MLKQLVYLKNEKLYYLREIRRVSVKWMLFRCDKCNRMGQVILRKRSYMVAVEPEKVRREFWDKYRWQWFERQFGVYGIKFR
jgi:hypothetical protein